jgi:hypothetical protein
VKTVVEIPDQLLQRARRIAAARRQKLNDLVIEGLKGAIGNGGRQPIHHPNAKGSSSQGFEWLKEWRALARKNRAKEANPSAAKTVSRMRR